MIPNSCAISCIANAYGHTANGVHRTALAMGMDCKKGGLNVIQIVKIINRLVAKGYTLRHWDSILFVYNDYLEYHATLLNNDYGWCMNTGYYKKIPEIYLPTSELNLKNLSWKTLDYDSISLMQWCNSNCNYRITNKKVLKWFDLRDSDPVDCAIRHIKKYRKLRGY